MSFSSPQPQTSTEVINQQPIIIPLDFVKFVPQSSHVSKSDDDASATTVIKSIPHCPLFRSQSELKEIDESLQGGCTFFKGLPFEIFDEYIHTVKDPKEFSKDDLEKTLYTEAKEIKEYCICNCYTPQMINGCVKLGLFPMAIRLGKGLPEFLSPKLDYQRNIIRLPCTDASSSTTLTLPPGIRKKSKKYALVIDGGFWEICCEELIAQHERGKSKHSWLNPFLLRSYLQLNIDHNQQFETNVHCITVVHASMVPELVAARSRQREAKTEEEKKKAKENFNSIARKAFCAGELGTTCASTYSSLSGGYRVDGTGSIQLGVLSALLIQLGYKIWDLGQGMEYKRKMLGSVDIPRKEWIEVASENSRRDPDVRKLSSIDGYVVRCDSIINATVYFNRNSANKNKKRAEDDEKVESD